MQRARLFRLLPLIGGLAAVLPLAGRTHAQTGGRPDIIWMRGGHDRGPAMMDFLDNDRIVTAGDFGTIKIHRVSDGLMLRSAPTVQQVGRWGKASPDGKWFAMENYDRNALNLWNMDTLTQTYSLLGNARDIIPSFSADSSLVADNYTIYRISDGSVFWKPIKHFQSMSFDGTLVASDGGDVTAFIGGLERIVGSIRIPWLDPITLSQAPFSNFAFKVAGYANSGFVIAGDKSWFISQEIRHERRAPYLWPYTALGDRYLFGAYSFNETPTNQANNTVNHTYFEAYDTITGGRYRLVDQAPIPRFGVMTPTGLAASPNGRLAAISFGIDSAGGMPTLQVVNVPDGTPAADLNMHSRHVRGIAYSAQPLSFLSQDGKSTISSHVVASVGWDSALFLWDARTGQRLSTVTLPGVPNHHYFVAISPDSRTVAIQAGPESLNNYANVLLYDITNPRNPVLQTTITASTLIYRPVFSHDGQYLAFGSTGRPGTNTIPAVSLYKKENGAWIGAATFNLEDNTGPIQCVFAHDDSPLIVNNYNIFTRLAIPTLNPLTQSQRNYPSFNDMALTDDGTRLIGTSGGPTYVLNATTFQTIFQDNTLPGYAVAVDPSSDTFSYRHLQPDGAGFANLFFRSTVDGSLKRTYNEETGLTSGIASGDPLGNAAAYSPDGQFLVLGREDVAIVVMKNPYWTAPTPKSLTAPSPSVGGKTITATVVLSGPAQVGGTSVTLASSDSNLAVVPAKTTVPVGKRSITFPVSLAATQTSKTVTLSATANGVTKTFVLTVSPVNILTTKATLTRVGGELVGAVTVTNSGSGDALNTRLTQASLGGVATLTTLPIALGTIPPGQSRSTTVRFSGTIAGGGAASTLRLGGDSSFTTFSTTIRVVLP